MTTIFLRRPVRQTMSLFNGYTPMRNRSWRRPAWQEAADWALPVDVLETKDAYVVKASIPGVDPEDLDISLEDNVLSIQAEVKADESDQNEQYHLRERRFGSFSRDITFPLLVDVQGVEANYEQGVLTVHVPKAEEVKPKRITIKAS